MNSGDWVESLTAIVEHFDGRLEILSYADFLGLVQAESPGKKMQPAV